MLPMNPPTSNPVISRKHGTGALKAVPFKQPGKPFHSTVQEPCREIQLPKISDARGSLSFIEGGNHIPFEIDSARWISDESETVAARGTNGNGRVRARQEFIIPVSGSVEVTFDNGWSKKCVRLDRPDQGLYVPNASRRQVRRLSENSAVLILTSAPTHETVVA